MAQHKSENNAVKSKKILNHTGLEAELREICHTGQYGWTYLDERIRRGSSLQKTSELYLAKQEGPNLYVHILDASERPFLDL